MAGHDKITKGGARFHAEMNKLKNLQVRVGFQRGKAKGKDHSGKETEVDMCDIAMFNELGTSTSPSRPFMRQSVDKNAEKINRFMKSQLQRIKNGQATAEDVMKAIGTFQKGLVQKEIRDGEFEPNAPSTISKKGSSKPLIDTGHMRQSVNFVICKKGDFD